MSTEAKNDKKGKESQSSLLDKSKGRETAKGESLYVTFIYHKTATLATDIESKSKTKQPGVNNVSDSSRGEETSKIQTESNNEEKNIEVMSEEPCSTGVNNDSDSSQREETGSIQKENNPEEKDTELKSEEPCSTGINYESDSSQSEETSNIQEESYPEEKDTEFEPEEPCSTGINYESDSSQSEETSSIQEESYPEEKDTELKSEEPCSTGINYESDSSQSDETSSIQVESYPEEKDTEFEPEEPCSTGINYESDSSQSDETSSIQVESYPEEKDTEFEPEEPCSTGINYESDSSQSEETSSIQEESYPEEKDTEFEPEEPCSTGVNNDSDNSQREEISSFQTEKSPEKTDTEVKSEEPCSTGVNNDSDSSQREETSFIQKESNPEEKDTEFKSGEPCSTGANNQSDSSKREESSFIQKESNPKEKNTEVKPEEPCSTGVNNDSGSSRGEESSFIQKESLPEVKPQEPCSDQKSNTEDKTDTGSKSDTKKSSVDNDSDISEKQETNNILRGSNLEEEVKDNKPQEPCNYQNSDTKETFDTENPDSELEIKQFGEQENSDGQQTDETNKPDGSNKPVILTEKDVTEFLSAEVTKIKEDLKREYLEEKEENTKRSRKTMPQPFPFTTVCVTSLICIGWSYLYSTLINPIPPEIAEFANKYKNFCDVNKITDKEECFQKFKNQQIANGPYDVMASEIGKLSSNVCSLDNETKLMKSGQNTLKQKVEKTESLLNICKESNESLTKQINAITIELERQGLNMSVVKGIQEYSDNTKADKGIMYLVTIILATGELCIFLVLCTKGAQQVRALRERTGKNDQTGNANMSNGIKSVLDEIHRKADLENSLCVVSFNNSTQAKHCQMVNSFINPKIEKRAFLVNKHGDLRDIPASKICMVFVDFNARNVILESERELGDLRKTTVKAIWKIGGNVVLVYCGDGYAEVTDNALYSHRLTSIRSRDHEELKQLEAKQCVLSVKDNKFSDFQKKHLKDLIQQFLKQ